MTISTCANNFGPYQFPEKLIPLFTTLAIDDQPLPLYRSSANRREWLYVTDHCRAIDLILKKGPDRRALQHRQRRRAERRGDHRPDPRPAGQAADPEDATSPTAPATTAATC